MRKIYFLLLLLSGTGSLSVLAQDAANFTVTIGTNNVVHFNNTSTTIGDAVRKAVWTFGDGQTATTGAKDGAEHLYATSGTYTACLKLYKKVNDEYSLTSQECKQVVIPAVNNATCKADFSTEPVTGSPLSRKFFAQPSNSQQKKPLRICWKFGDGKEECKEYTTLSTGPFVSDHTYATAGQYEACVTIKYDGGCEAKMCKVISVTTPPPPPPATCEMKFSEMASSVTTFKRTFIAAVMSNRAAEKICWTYGDGKDNCTQLSNPATQQSLTTSHEYAAPGVYRVCAKVSYAGGCTAEFCKEVVIKANNKTCSGEMSVAITEGKTAEFHGHGTANAAGHVTSYRWNFGDGTTGTGETIKHTFTAAGNYEVCLVINTDFGCETRICKHVVIGSTNNEPSLQLSPNPVVSELHIGFRSSRAEMVTIYIYNANGIVMKTFQRSASVGQNNWGIDVSSLPQGIYSVIVRSPNQLANALFTKQ